MSRGTCSSRGNYHQMPVFCYGELVTKRYFEATMGKIGQVKHDHRDNGTYYTTISDRKGNRVTFCSVPTNHERNRSRARSPYMEKGRKQRDHEYDMGKGVSQ